MARSQPLHAHSRPHHRHYKPILSVLAEDHAQIRQNLAIFSSPPLTRHAPNSAFPLQSSNRPSELFSPVGAIPTKFNHLGLSETVVNLVRLLGHSAAASSAVREIAISPQSRIIRHILVTSTQNRHLPQTSIRAFHASPITGDILIPCWTVFESPQSDQVKRNFDLSTTRKIHSKP